MLLISDFIGPGGPNGRRKGVHWACYGRVAAAGMESNATRVALAWRAGRTILLVLLVLMHFGRDTLCTTCAKLLRSAPAGPDLLTEHFNRKAAGERAVAERRAQKAAEKEGRQPTGGQAAAARQRRARSNASDQAEAAAAEAKRRRRRQLMSIQHRH